MKLKFLTVTLLSVAFLFFCTTMSLAGVVKWSQLPSMIPDNGYSFSSETQVSAQVADDFLCQSGNPVIGLTWWGSYWDPTITGTSYYPYSNSDNWGDPVNNPPGIVTGFNINFYQDIPDGQGVPPWSHPGSQVYAEYVPLDGVQVQEAIWGKISRSASTQTVFKYDAKLPIAFDQQSGNIYWLSIQALDPGGNPVQWGWQESVDSWNDNAVQIGYAPQKWWDKLPGENMAFGIKAVPIPGAIWILGAGLLGLLGFKKRFVH
jgi:hypothetical protein